MSARVMEQMRESRRRIAGAHGTFDALSAAVPDVSEMIECATSQIVETMLGSQIAASTSDETLEFPFSAVVHVAIDDRFMVCVGIHLPRETAAAAAIKMTGMSETELTDAECLSIAGELGNMVTGRMKTQLRERSMQCVCSIPALHQGRAFPLHGKAESLVRRYTMSGAGDLFISLVVQGEDAGAKGEGRSAK